MSKLKISGLHNVTEIGAKCWLHYAGCKLRIRGKPLPVKFIVFMRPISRNYRGARSVYEESDLLFMVIETYRNQNANPVYERFRNKGRLMPEGLTYINSWVQADLTRCFQLMECDNVALLQQWVKEWSDLVAFEIVPVNPSQQTAEAI